MVRGWMARFTWWVIKGESLHTGGRGVGHDAVDGQVGEVIEARD